MSRSYRKPYTAITGVSSAHHDKKTAVRGMRRRQNAWLRNLDDFAGMNEVYRQHVGSTPPARSTVEVGRLPSGALVEIEAIATAGAS